MTPKERYQQIITDIQLIKQHQKYNGSNYYTRVNCFEYVVMNYHTVKLLEVFNQMATDTIALNLLKPAKDGCYKSIRIEGLKILIDNGISDYEVKVL